MDEEQIIKKLKDILDDKGFKGYDTSEFQDFSVHDKKQQVLRDGTKKDIYNVMFWSIPLHGERFLLFAVMDADTLDFLYMGGPSGYIEV